MTRYHLLANKSMEWDSVELPKAGAKWNTRSQGAEDSVSCRVSVLQLPSSSWAAESPPAILQWHWVASDADMGYVGWSVHSSRAQPWSTAWSQHLVLGEHQPLRFFPCSTINSLQQTFQKPFFTLQFFHCFVRAYVTSQDQKAQCSLV